MAPTVPPPPGPIFYDGAGHPFTLDATGQAVPVFAPSPAVAPAPAAPAAVGPSRAQAAAPWIAILLGVVYFGYKEWHAPAAATPDGMTGPAAPVDPTALNLGAAYRKAVDLAPLAGLDAAAADVRAANLLDLVQDQRDALTAAQREAWRPVADEAQRRFGIAPSVGSVAGSPGLTTDPATLTAARTFFAAVATGYRKGGK